MSDEPSAADDSASPRVRIRGIYATALTARLRTAGVEVVQASPPIRRRFDAAFETAEHDVRVETTADRQGVELSGAPAAVDPVRESIVALARDAFAWSDPLARGAVLDAVVERTIGGGAVLDVGDGEAYLPFGNADVRVDEGDALRVQVYEPAPPWADDRAVVGTELRVAGGIATLVRGAGGVVGTPDGTQELARMTDLLSAEAPDGWGIRWERAADGAAVATLDAALAAAAERARAFDAALAERGDAADRAPAPVHAPGTTVWCWLGRESRFALDDDRREAAPTMAGHHRVKAAATTASDAVDFVERIGPPVEEFPLAATLDQFGPEEGDRVAIGHGKPEGRLVTLGRGTVTERDPEAGSLTIEREMTGGGSYDALEVPRTEGDVATTRFREGRWWYPTVYRGADGGVKGTYVNVCTPVEIFPGTVRYVDLHVDVIKHASGDVEIVDEDDLRGAVDAGHVRPALAERARDVAERVAGGIGG